MLGLSMGQITDFATQSSLVATGGPNSQGFMTIVCKTAGTLQNIVLRYPEPGQNQLTTVAMEPGDALYGIKEANLVADAGVYQVFYHKS